MAKARQRRYKELHLGQLRAFCECVRLKSYAAAGRALQLSQPAIWHQVKALEQTYGVTLLQRHGRELLPTEDGRVFWELANSTLGSADSLRDQFEEVRGRVPRTLTVVGTPGILAEEMAPVVADFCRLYPQVRLTLLSRQGPRSLDSLIQGDADLAMMPEGFSFTNRHLFDAEVLSVRQAALDLPAGHPLVRRRRITPADVVRCPLLLPEAENNPWYGALIAMLRSEGLLDQLNVAAHVSNYTTARRLVALGLGIALGSHSATDSLLPNVVSRFLGDPFPSQRLLLLWHRGSAPRPQARQFAELLRAAMALRPSHG